MFWSQIGNHETSRFPKFPEAKKTSMFYVLPPPPSYCFFAEGEPFSPIPTWFEVVFFSAPTNPPVSDGFYPRLTIL